MIADLNQAESEIAEVFWNAWASAASLNGGSVPQVDWDGVLTEPPFEPPEAEPWARFQIRHRDSDQATLGRQGQRRFENRGQVTVQIFAPMTISKDRSLANDLTQIVVDAYEGQSTAGGVWFRRVTPREVGRDPAGGPWYQVNVVAAFEYDRQR